MTLTTHAVVGAAIAGALADKPILAILLAFLSHFILDAIPHWDYTPRSAVRNPDRPLDNDLKIGHAFFFDLLVIAGDFFLGLFLAALVFYSAPAHVVLIALLGAIAAMAPDFLQFVYMKWRHEPMTSLQRFHLASHAKRDLKAYPVAGVTIQLIVILIATAFVIY